MKKIIYLITFLLLSNLYISQTISTSPTNCIIPNEQVSEIYKGLKQGEYLKVRLDKTDKALSDATDVVGEQKKIIVNLKETITLKDSILIDNVLKCSQEKEIKDITINQLQETMKLNEKQYKKEARKKMWTGIKIGGISVAVLSTAAFLLIK